MDAMKRTVADVAASVAAGAITWLIFDLISDASVVVKVVAASAVTVLSLLVAFSLRRREPDARVSTAVADRVRAAEDVTVEGIDLEGDGDTRVGTRMKAGGSVTIRDVDIKRGDPE
jgi:hypothetical protein